MDKLVKDRLVYIGIYIFISIVIASFSIIGYLFIGLKVFAVIGSVSF